MLGEGDLEYVRQVLAICHDYVQEFDEVETHYTTVKLKEAIFWLGEARGESGLKDLKRLLKELPVGDTRRHINFAVSQSEADGAADLLQKTSESDPSSRGPKQISARSGEETTRSSPNPAERLSERDDWLTIARTIAVTRSTR